MDPMKRALREIAKIPPPRMMLSTTSDSWLSPDIAERLIENGYITAVETRDSKGASMNNIYIS